MPVPSDTSLFPAGFPSNKHPVLVYSGFTNDIRMISLQIKNLFSAGIYIPYVDRLPNSGSPFLYPLRNYLGGYNGQDIAPLIPGMSIS
jgi:hypothetical protein